MSQRKPSLDPAKQGCETITSRVKPQARTPMEPKGDAMHRKLMLFVAIILTGSTIAYAVRQSHAQSRPTLHPDAIYFAYHINARLQDRTLNHKDWGMPKVREEVNQMMAVFQTTNNHDDLVKEAVDVAVAAMMMAHNEGQKSSPMAIHSTPLDR